MSSPDRAVLLYTDQRLASENRWLKLGLIIYGGVIALSGATAYEASSIIPHASLIIEIPTIALALATLPNLVGATRDFLTNNGERYLRRSIASGETMRSLPQPAGPPQIGNGGTRPLRKLADMNDQEELLIVVDDEDNVLNYLPRSEVHQKKLLHRTISVVVFTSKRELVIQIRGLNKDTYPGYYSNAAGGHVTKGQSYEEAAKQEALEEIGLDQPLEFVTKKILEDPKHRTMTSIFKTTSNGPFKKNPTEVEDIIKVPLSEVKNLTDKFYPATLQVLTEVGVL